MELVFQSEEDIYRAAEHDGIPGCSPMGRATLWAILFRLNHSNPRYSDEQKDIVFTVCDQMSTYQPAMAIQSNLKEILLQYLKKERSNGELADFCRRLIDHSLSCVKTVGELGAEYVKDRDKIMVHSVSSSLLSVIDRILDVRKDVEFLLCVNYPGRMSLRTAEYIIEKGGRVTAASDASMLELVRQADIVFSGADAITAAGDCVNEIGTGMLAELTKSQGKPYYVLSEIAKLDLRTLDDYSPDLSKGEDTSVIRGFPYEDSPLFSFYNYRYEKIDRQNITAIITEYGAIPPEKAVQTYQRYYKTIAGETWKLSPQQQ